jgi:hypothetical protein
LASVQDGSFKQSHRILVEKSVGKFTLERLRRKWEDNIDFKEWIKLAQGRV